MALSSLGCALVSLTFCVGAGCGAPPVHPGAAVDGYPVVLPLASKKQIANAEAAFRAGNPGEWKLVAVDPYGFIDEVLTEDPTALPFDASSEQAKARTRAFIANNATRFGIPADFATRIQTDSNAWELSDRSGPEMVLADRDQPSAAEWAGKKNVTVFASFEPIAPSRVKVSTESAIARVVGHSYRQLVIYTRPARLDCELGPRGAAGCSSSEITRVERDVTFKAEMLRTRTLLLRTRRTPLTSFASCGVSSPTWVPSVRNQMSSRITRCRSRYSRSPTSPNEMRHHFHS